MGTVIDFKVIEKGYRVNLDKIEEGYAYSEIGCSALSASKAKAKLLRDAGSMALRFTNEDVSFINIPVVRHKEYDKVLYNGEEMPRWKMEDKKKVEKFMSDLQIMADDSSVTHCYIRKRGLYYRDNNCGYVEERMYAGIYLKEEALLHAKGCLELTVVPIDVKEHNAYIQKHIANLTMRIIK